VKQFSVEHEGRIIPVTLTRKQVKNVNFRIKRDQSVAVSAAKHVPLTAIEELIRKKAKWIINHFERYARLQENWAIHYYESGETLRYLGNTFKLKVQPALTREEVLIDNDNIYLMVRADRDNADREKVIDSWYREKAESLFSQALDRVYPLIAEYRVEIPLISIRKMKTRWGSCSRSKKKINLNTELVKTPLACIDYVVPHELIHFIHPNHGKSFYSCLTALMPDWKERRKLLKTNSLPHPEPL
jgi:predicted metal-dependent hydrolase